MSQRRPSMTRRRIAFSAVALIAALSLGGCSVIQKAGSAAIVNGTSLSTAEVAETIKQINDHLVTDPAQKLKEKDVVGRLVLAQFVVAYVDRTGKWKPDASYNTLLAKVPDATDVTKRFLKFNVIAAAQVLTSKDVDVIVADFQKAKVEVDPRYGTFDPTKGDFVPRVDNWIKPTPAPTDAATAPAPGQ